MSNTDQVEMLADVKEPPSPLYEVQAHEVLLPSDQNLNPATAVLLSSQTKIHHKEAGINSLVDAAAPLFSKMGKIKQTKYCDDLKNLQSELIEDIEDFKKTLAIHVDRSEHLAEYLPISAYALCMTIDDIILTTSWGGQGAWNENSLVDYYNDTALTQDNFLIILERLILDPDIYIDVIEFFYICLSLGFTCKRSQEFSFEQLERIMDSLYKRIRQYHGAYSKILAPFMLPRHQKAKKPDIKNLKWMTVGICLACGLFSAYSIGSYITYSTIKKDIVNVQQESRR